MIPEYPFHKGARTALIVTGVLLCVLCITFPVGLYFIWRVLKGGVTMTNSGVVVKGLTNDSFEFADVQRLGLLKVPMVGRGIGGTLANMRLDNMGYGLNLVVKLRNGKERKFLLNQFERHQELTERITKASPVPVEELTMGLLGPKWPEKA
ncbi:MAG: hypothetical protein AB1730_21875 [Myxococcota bacterium]|jgi:hypothetical protein